MRKTFDVNIYIETDTAEARRQYRGYGVIVEFLLKNGEPVTRDAYGLADATGNQIMLMALIDALKILTKPCNVIIYMDNRYVSENIRLGHIYEWFANGWKTLRNEPIANAEEWRELMGLIEGHELAFAPTREHSYKDCLQYAIRKLKDQGENWQQRLID